MTVNFFTSLLVVAMMAAVFIGFARIWDSAGSPVIRNLSKGVMTVCLTLVARSSYWDVTQRVLGDAWPAVSAALGGQQFSTVFNLGAILAAYFFLRAKWWLIPDEERSEWHWYSAWLYPPRRSLHLKVEK